MKFADWLQLDPVERWDGGWESCGSCHDYFQESECIMLTPSVETPYARFGMVCGKCADRARDFYRQVCPICGVIGHREFDFASVGSDGYVCRQCHNKYVWAHRSGLDEERRTVGQRWRAQKNGLPATLTVVEWIQTLIDFEYRCAYCRGSFHDLEHYVPISQGGGTTVDNCVPACSSCNSSKVRLNTRSATRRVSAASLERVGAYLRNRVQRTPVTAERAGQTLPIPARYWTQKYYDELGTSGHNPHAEALAARFVRKGK